MAGEVVMPRLSDSMEEGTILKWLVDQGSEVKRGEPLVEIETDKANMTYDADTDGVLVEILAKEGETLAVGEPIARIGAEGEEASRGGAERGRGADEEAGGEQDEAGGGDDEEAGGEQDEGNGQDEEQAGGGDGGDAREDEGEAGNGGAPERRRERQPAAATAGDDGERDGERVKASPVARRMAREMGVELTAIDGSGPGGRILKADVEKAAGDGDGARAPEEREAGRRERAAPGRRSEAGAKGEAEVHELTRLQQTVSRRMAESKATAPDFALTVDVDMTLCVELRERLKQVADPAPSYNDMIVKACANALREFPRANGAYRDGKFELYSRVNVGIAVAAQDALVVPTIFDADRRSLGAIAREARALAEKVRAGKITPPEVSGGTFTVSNLGMYGIDRFTAVINPPQAAILTVGSLAKRPHADDRGRLSARDTVTLTLVCDHRILYGAEGAEFLARIREQLEQPLSLAL